jgi:hypothetical protein
MDCKIPGRSHLPAAEPDAFTYGLEHLAPGQKKYAHQKANAFLQKVMMDPKAPDILKAVIRSQNAIGIMAFQQLLAAHVESELKGMF